MNESRMSEFAVVRGLVDRVRARLRRARLLRAGGLVVASVALAVLAGFALDYVLDLPRGVRAVHLALTAVALLVVARWAFAPLRRRPSDERLAEAIEHDVPEFRDRLLSALDFERRVADPAEPESREMMRAASADAAAIAARIEPSLLVDGRPARRALALAGIALLGVLAADRAFPEEFALWLRRGLLVADVDWPKRTDLRVLDFPADGSPLVVTRGQDLRVVAVAEGAVPDDVVLHLEELADGEGGEDQVAYRDERRMTPDPDQAGRFAFDFRAVAASFRFWVTGGDDLDDRPKYSVRALVPPRVASFEAVVTPPVYSRVARSVVTEPVFGALTGSKVEFTFQANMPLAAVQLVSGDRPPADLPLAADRKGFAYAFELGRTTEFHLKLRADDGHENRSEDDVFHVEAVTDRSPTVRLLHPRTRLLATPRATVPLKFEADDDFGLDSATIEGRVETRSESAGAPLWSAVEDWRAKTAAGDGQDAAPVKHAHTYRAIDLESFQGDGAGQVKPDDQLVLTIRAQDAGGQESDASEVRVEIVSSDTMSQRLVNEMSRLREELTQARRSQQRSVAALRELRTSGAADAAAARRARDLQVDQGRVVNDARRFLNGVERVLDAHVLNRLGSVPTVERLLPLYHEFLSQPIGDTGEVFPPALYAKILKEKRENRLYDPELIGILLDVADLADVVVSATGPAAYESLDRWTSDDARTSAGLAPAVEAAEALQSGLDAIEARLQKFEDLAQIILLAKEIRDGQENLTRRPATSTDAPSAPERDR